MVHNFSGTRTPSYLSLTPSFPSPSSGCPFTRRTSVKSPLHYSLFSSSSLSPPSLLLLLTSLISLPLLLSPSSPLSGFHLPSFSINFPSLSFLLLLLLVLRLFLLCLGVLTVCTTTVGLDDQSCPLTSSVGCSSESRVRHIHFGCVNTVDEGPSSLQELPVVIRFPSSSVRVVTGRDDDTRTRRVGEAKTSCRWCVYRVEGGRSRLVPVTQDREGEYTGRGVRGKRTLSTGSFFRYSTSLQR